MKVTIRSDTNSLDWNCKGSKRVIQNVLNLVNTVKYEVAFDRTKGLSIKYIGEPSPSIIAQYTSEVTEVIEQYEPRAKVDSVNFISINEEGDMIFEIIIEI